MTTDVSPYPLHWPPGRPRTPYNRRTHPKFGDHTVAQALGVLYAELDRLRAKSVVLSSNIPLGRDGRPLSIRGLLPDPGVAVYFTRGGTPYQLACDRWLEVAHNIWAIARHIEALRGQERWGVGTVEQAFAGYAALPPPGSGTGVMVVREAPPAPWWEVLKVTRDAPLPVAEAAFRALAKEAHPDAGGSTARMQALATAIAAARAEKGAG